MSRSNRKSYENITTLFEGLQNWVAYLYAIEQTATVGEFDWAGGGGEAGGRVGSGLADGGGGAAWAAFAVERGFCDS